MMKSVRTGHTNTGGGSVYSIETESQKPDFIENFEVMLPVNQAHGPGEYEQPHKPWSKVFEDDDLEK
jgi:hypothetical protein